jgi:hypothetical protein
MTKDEIKLVVFILSAVLIGALAQHYRTRLPNTSEAPVTPPPHGWAKPPYVLKETKGSRSKPSEPEPDAQ